MYFTTLLLFILFLSLLLRYLNFLLGRNLSAEFAESSTHTKVNPPSSTHGSVNEKVQAADLSKIQIEPTSSSSSDSPNPQTVASPSNWEHDVFLSFRGEDTRYGFTDHLYYALDKKGINVFRDTEKLGRGKSISPELLKAIEESKFAVVVLSPNYATSSWCLDELAHIVKCMKLRGLEILPVFYRVEPSEIRWQSGNYGEAFAKHETKFKDNITKVEDWRKALKEVANLSGDHVTKDRSEAEVIQKIAKMISDILNDVLCKPDRDLIGMDVRIEKMESCLDLRSSDVFAVGIWGMGGIGKSTLAKEVFKKIRNEFDVSGFVSISKGGSYSEEEALVELQKLLCGSFFGDSNINIDTVGRGIKMLKRVLCKKKVLIVLDNVVELKQLKGLAPGMQDEENSWAPGSRLIITTRDRRTLTECGVLEYKIYEVEKLNDVEAIHLICQKAFKKNDPPDEFVKLSESFVKYAGGIPLAHKVLGSHLSGRDAAEWSEVLDRLDEDPDKDIFSVLQISFDGLHGTEKEIFLDIACFFNGEDQVRVEQIWRNCRFSPITGIRNLINKSLIKIEKKKLWMHDLLRCLGWHIVRKESSSPGKRSRLWLDNNVHKYEGRSSWRFEDARNVLVDNTGTAAVECLFLSLPEKDEMSLEDDPFLTMCNLRLLKIYNVNFVDVQFGYVSKNLRLLEWHECPLESFPSNFKLGKLVEIKMPNSCIKQLWNDNLSLEKLILMDLSHCKSLATTPDFSKVPNLERLILEGCTELSVVHPSIGSLKKLVLLNLKGCASLESLPHSINLRSLRIFILSGCSKLIQFPEIVENMDALAELYLDGTAIQELPLLIEFLKGLVLLNLSGCRNLRELPSFLCSSLTSMKFLYLSMCSSMGNLPDNIGCLEHLEELDACYTDIKKVPESIRLLKNLKLLCFHGCSEFTGLELPNSFSGLGSLTTLNLGGCNLSQGALPEDTGDLLSLQSLDLSENNFSTIPSSISQLSELTEISLFKCSKLQLLSRDLPASLRNLDVRGCPPHKGLSLRNCRKPDIFPELYEFRLADLIELNLSGCQHLKKIPDLNGVPNLKKLNLEGCEKLSEVNLTVGRLQHLIFLSLKGCIDLGSLPSPISLKSLEVLVLSGCSKLKEFPDINGDMDHLSELHLDGTALMYPAIPSTHLKCPILINLSGCRQLRHIPTPSCLKSLNLSGCREIKSLPSDQERRKHMKELDVSETSIKQFNLSYWFFENVQVLSFCGCEGLQLPNWFSSLVYLESLNLRRCGLAEENLDILYHLSSLESLDLGENSLVTIPNGIGRLSCLHRLNLSGNNFSSLPQSISYLSKLSELHLSRCSNLQSLPNDLPLSLKHVYAQECPLLKYNADTLTRRISGGGFYFMHCEQSLPVPVSKDPIELTFPEYIKNRIDGKKPFEIRFPHGARIPYLWSHWMSGPSVTAPLSDGNSACLGLALFIVFEIQGQGKGKFNEIWELEETICKFHTDIGRESSLVFQNFIGFSAGSYALCCYEPRGGRCRGIFDEPSSKLRASVSTKRPDLKVRGCGILLLSEADKFVRSLANLTGMQHSNFDKHCEACDHILEDKTTTGELMELGSTSTFNEDSSSSRCKSCNLNIQLREELLILYQGSNARAKSFYLGFQAPIFSFPPWFFNHHAGDVTICKFTGNLVDDQTWVGLELYVVLTRRDSASSDDAKSISFHVDLCVHDRASIVLIGSLKLDSFSGTSDQLVVIHLPRVCFQQRLYECQGISALFRSIDQGMEVQVCGSRLLFERDLQELIHSLAAAAGTLGIKHVVEKENAHFLNLSFRRTKIKLNPSIDSLNPGFVQVPEQASTSSVTRLQNYRGYFQKNQGSIEFNTLLHSRGCPLENRDNQEYVAEEDTASLLNCHHLCVMVETLVYGTYTSREWRRCLQLLLQHSKVATFSNNGYALPAFKHFNPSSTYNVCLSNELPRGFFSERHCSSGSRVGMSLPPKLCDDNNWRGLVICATIKVDDQHSLFPVVKLLCHLRSKYYCLKPIPMCSITGVKLLEPLYRGGFIWVTYIPRAFLTEFNIIGDVEAVIDINCPILRVASCRIRLLHQQEEEEFREVITGCCTSLFDDLPRIQDIAVPETLQIGRKWKGGNFPLLEGQIKEFDRDSIYNATPPTSLHIPTWFRRYTPLTRRQERRRMQGREREQMLERELSLELELPAPSLCSDKSWIGLALCASVRHFSPADPASYLFNCRLRTKNNDLSFDNDYRMTPEEVMWHSLAKARGKFLWLTYIPRRWFLHQLNGESALFASFGVKYGKWETIEAAHRFVYEHEVEEFKQLCTDLHQSVSENDTSD